MATRAQGVEAPGDKDLADVERWAWKQGNISEHTALALAAAIRQLRSEKERLRREPTSSNAVEVLTK